MIAPFALGLFPRRAFVGFAFVVPLVLASAVALRANTPGVTRSVSAGGCYCDCSHSKTKSGCVKICELPRYASRWWANTCAKPRVSSPADNHGAGPRLPHPDRAERASK